MRLPLSRKDRQKIDRSSIKKILLIRLRRIGDIMMTTPAAAILREAFPDARITYIVESPYKDLVQGHSLFDRVIVLPRNLNKREFFQFVRRIRKEDYDVAIDFHGGPKASLMSFFSRAKLKIGYKIKYKSFVYDIKIPRGPEKGYIHSVENHVNLVKALDVSFPSIPRMSFPSLSPLEKQNLHEYLVGNNLDNKHFIVLHIGAGNEFRFWGKENLTGFIKMITQNLPVTVILVGGKEDSETERALLESCSSAVLSLVGEIDLKQLYGIISKASLFIGPDSGPMHMAAATTTPIVALFGPMVPEIFGPWRARSIILEKDLECRPCQQRKCLYGDFRCFRTIHPYEVYNASLQFLQDPLN